MKADERELLRRIAAPDRPWPRDVIAGMDIAPKRAWYILEKFTRRGWYNYGVAVDLGWLEPEGYAAAQGTEQAK